MVAPAIVFGGVQEIEVVAGPPDVSGPPVFLIRGVLPAGGFTDNEAAELIPPDDPYREEKLASRARWRTNVEYHISRSDYRMLRRFDEMYTEGWSRSLHEDGTRTFKALPVTMRTDVVYYDFNAPITIEVPSID